MTPAPLLGSVFMLQKMKTMMGTFQPVTGHFRECVLPLAALATGDADKSLLAVETSDLPYILKLDSSDKKS